MRRISYLKHPKWLLLRFAERRLMPMGDKMYLKMRYREVFGKNLNLDSPQTFNEKLQWLKLYDRKPEYTIMVDKFEVKEYVARMIGEKYIIPTIGIYDSFDQINFDELPNQFVIKCTHDSGGLVVCRDKKKFDVRAAKKKINNCLKNNFFWSGREWPYKNVRPRIMVEKCMSSRGQKELVDYKFYCFSGEPKFLYVSEGLEDHSTAKISFFDMNFKMCEFGRNDFKKFDVPPKKPVNFDKMVEVAKELSSGVSFVRVDLYEIGGKVYFGELTFTPNAGLMQFDPPEWDKKIGDMLELPRSGVM